MSTIEKLDKVDLQILRTLQNNARLTTKELAASVSLSSTPVFERLKRLENGGVYKEIYCRAGCRKAKPGVRGLLQCQVEKAEQRDCGEVHKDHTGDSASHGMLQHIGEL